MGSEMCIRDREHRELPQWGPGAPAANAFLVFLAYLKPTDQPIKSSIFRKRPLSRTIRGMATGQSPPHARGVSGEAWLPWLRACIVGSRVQLQIKPNNIMQGQTRAVRPE